MHPNDQPNDNTIGPTQATTSSSPQVDNPWGVPLIESRALYRMPLMDLFVKDNFISYRIATTTTKGVKHSTTIYGVNTHRESFAYQMLPKLK